MRHGAFKLIIFFEKGVLGFLDFFAGGLGLHPVLSIMLFWKFRPFKPLVFCFHSENKTTQEAI